MLACIILHWPERGRTEDRSDHSDQFCHRFFASSGLWSHPRSSQYRLAAAVYPRVLYCDGGAAAAAAAADAAVIACACAHYIVSHTIYCHRIFACQPLIAVD